MKIIQRFHPSINLILMFIFTSVTSKGLFKRVKIKVPIHVEESVRLSNENNHRGETRLSKTYYLKFKF